MAIKSKVDNVILKRIAQKKERELRRLNTKAIRKRYLIVCEGQKTEPNYFESLKLDLPRGILNIEIIGLGEDPLNIVNYAISKKNQEIKKSKKDNLIQKYDHIWVVFDRNSFSAQRFNEAIQKSKNYKLSVAYSNEVFELWYLLHFEFYNTGISRTEYKKKLTRHLGFKYKKNSNNMYRSLNEKGNQKNAIKWAEKLYQESDRNNIADANPSTTVHRLVNELNKYIN